MPDEVTFIDLATITRITPDTTLEKLGSIINASIFDASNLAGSLKQKGLIDFMAYYPGPNTIKVTDLGRSLVADADAKAAEPFDSLDHEILKQLSGGKRAPLDLQTSMNVRPKDLALRLYKLSKQGFASYELRSGGSEVSLTETGFLKARAPFASPQQPQQHHEELMEYTPPTTQPQQQKGYQNPSQPAPAQPAPVQATQQPQPQQPQNAPQAPSPAAVHANGSIPKIPIAITVVIIAILVLLRVLRVI